MSADKKVFVALITHLPLITLVGEKIYRVRAPKRIEDPYVVFMRISTQVHNTLNTAEEGSAETPTFQVDIFDTNADQAREIADAATQALEAIGCLKISDNDLYLYGAEFPSVSLDFRFWQ